MDVYSAWIDACEEVNKRKKLEAQRARERNESPPPQDYSEDRLNPFDEDEDDDDY